MIYAILSSLVSLLLFLHVTLVLLSIPIHLVIPRQIMYIIIFFEMMPFRRRRLSNLEYCIHLLLPTMYHLNTIPISQSGLLIAMLFILLAYPVI